MLRAINRELQYNLSDSLDAIYARQRAAGAGPIFLTFETMRVDLFKVGQFAGLEEGLAPAAFDPYPNLNITCDFGIKRKGAKPGSLPF